MSTILKALKKLEERKASEGQRNGDIAWDILREPGRDNERLLPSRWWLAGGAIFLVAALVFVWLTYRPLQKKDQIVTTVPTPSSLERPAAPQKVPPQRVTATSPLRAQPVVPPPAQPVVPPPAQPVVPPPAQPVVPPPAQPVVPPPAQPVVPPSPTVGLAPIPADLELKVSGIAFQEASEASIAIVNDLPVMVGTVIEGVVVEQIEEQRVVFSRDGERFAITLSVTE